MLTGSIPWPVIRAIQGPIWGSVRVCRIGRLEMGQLHLIPRTHPYSRGSKLQGRCCTQPSCPTYLNIPFNQSIIILQINYQIDIWYLHPLSGIGNFKKRITFHNHTWRKCLVMRSASVVVGSIDMVGLLNIIGSMQVTSLVQAHASLSRESSTWLYVCVGQIHTTISLPIGYASYERGRSG